MCGGDEGISIHALCECEALPSLSHSHWRTQGGGGCSNPLPPKFRSLEKAGPNSPFRGIYVSNNLIRIRVLFIYKLSETPK
jgi:hypothetical protein